MAIADIVGYEGRYRVTDGGEVLSAHSGWKARAPVIYAGGYRRVNLSLSGRARLHLVHRLVAEAFIPNPDGKPQVNHLNGDKSDNRASNLEWATCSENHKHKFRHLGAGHNRRGKFGNNSIHAKSVLMLRPDNTGIYFPSGMDAVRSIGAKSSAISACCSGQLKTHKGYRWEYANKSN